MTLTSKVNLLYVGSKVAFTALPFQQGSYSEYVVADATSIFPLWMMYLWKMQQHFL
jgi:NADPH:quinone reductase-like Zn-dependent oxidoreductase